MLTPDRPRGRLHRDRARRRRLLQPAAQRSRSVCRRLRHRHTAEQPVRQVEGAVLAAGVHRSAEVRDPAATARRRLHDVLRGLPLHPATTRRSTRTSGARRRRSSEPPEVIVVPDRGLPAALRPAARGRTGSSRMPDHMAHPYEAELETLPGRAQGVRIEVRPHAGRRRGRRGKHQLEAVERWYRPRLERLDARLRSSIIEGIVVFLSLFDDNPAVHRAFCPPRSAYVGRPPNRASRGRCRRSKSCSNRPGAGAEFSGRP